MKYCEAYAALLDLYADGELTAEEMIRVQEHLDTCPGCQAYVDDVLAMRAAFPTVEETPVPDGFAEGVLAAIQASAVPAKKKRKTPWVGVLTSLAACCAIVLIQQNGPIRSNGAAMKTEAAPSAAMAQVTAEESFAEDCAETESIAEAPAELYYVTTDSATVSAGAETPAEEAPQAAPKSEPAEGGAAENGSLDGAARFSQPYCIRIEVDAAYLGDLMDEYTPVVVSHDAHSGEDSLHYELTLAQYETLLAQLAEKDELPAEEVFDTDSDTVLVVVRQG